MVSAQQPPSHSTVRFEDSLTWEEANQLRILASDAARKARGELLLAEDEGTPADGPRARHGSAVRLEAKVSALFYRKSGGA